MGKGVTDKTSASQIVNNGADIVLAGSVYQHCKNFLTATLTQSISSSSTSSQVPSAEAVYSYLLDHGLGYSIASTIPDSGNDDYLPKVNAVRTYISGKTTSSVTQNSTKLVTSGAVYSAIQSVSQAFNVLDATLLTSGQGEIRNFEYTYKSYVPNAEAIKIYLQVKGVIS